MTTYTLSLDQTSEAFTLKISSEGLEINLKLSHQDIKTIINNITNANWEIRNTIKAGVCLGANVFWCCDDNKTSVLLLIGQEDETWQIGLKLPFSIINDLQQEIKVHSKTSLG